MLPEREQYFRKDCGAAARNIFPNEIIPIQNYPQSQTNSSTQVCWKCNGRGEGAHGEICSACFSTGVVIVSCEREEAPLSSRSHEPVIRSTMFGDRLNSA